jgi:hypothetical protein
MRFYFYFRVPKDLIGHLKRKELKKSLKTADCRTDRKKRSKKFWSALSFQI